MVRDVAVQAAILLWQRRGGSLSELARRVDCSEAYLSLLAAGKRRASPRFRRQLVTVVLNTAAVRGRSGRMLAVTDDDRAFVAARPVSRRAIDRAWRRVLALAQLPCEQRNEKTARAFLAAWDRYTWLHRRRPDEAPPPWPAPWPAGPSAHALVRGELEDAWERGEREEGASGTEVTHLAKSRSRRVARRQRAGYLADWVFDDEVETPKDHAPDLLARHDDRRRTWRQQASRTLSDHIRAFQARTIRHHPGS